MIKTLVLIAGFSLNLWNTKPQPVLDDPGARQRVVDIQRVIFYRQCTGNLNVYRNDLPELNPNPLQEPFWRWPTMSEILLQSGSQPRFIGVNKPLRLVVVNLDGKFLEIRGTLSDKERAYWSQCLKVYNEQIPPNHP